MERRKYIVTETESAAAKALHSWERKLLIIAFAGWAAVVAAYGQASVNRIDTVVGEMSQERKSNEEYRTLMERRVAILESQQALLLKYFGTMEQHVQSQRQ